MAHTIERYRQSRGNGIQSAVIVCSTFKVSHKDSTAALATLPPVYGVHVSDSALQQRMIARQFEPIKRTVSNIGIGQQEACINVTDHPGMWTKGHVSISTSTST